MRREYGLIVSLDVTTYEQAMRFLSAEETTADEFIPSMFSLKVRLDLIAVLFLRSH